MYCAGLRIYMHMYYVCMFIYIFVAINRESSSDDQLISEEIICSSYESENLTTFIAQVIIELLLTYVHVAHSQNLVGL